MEHNSLEIAEIFCENTKFYKINDGFLDFEKNIFISNLKNKYFIFRILTTGKDRYACSPNSSYLCPKEVKEILINRLSLIKQPYAYNKEKIKILFYNYNKNIDNEEEANNAFKLNLYEPNPIQTIKFVVIQNTKNELWIDIPEKKKSEINFEFSDKILKYFKENEIFLKKNETYNNNNKLLLYKIDDEYYSYLGIITIFNQTNDNIIYKTFLNENARNAFHLKPIIFFVSPNDKIQIIIKKLKSNSNENLNEKLLFLFYAVSKIINNKEEVKEVFQSKLYDQSSKIELQFEFSYNENINNELNNFIKNNIPNNEKNISQLNTLENKTIEQKEIKDELNKNQTNEIKTNEEIQNNILIKRINELENELKIEKEKNNEINNIIKIYKEKEEKMNIYGNESKELLIQKLLEKDNEIKELKLKLSKFPFELNEGEELMCINFNSDDQKIKNYSIICKNSDIFNLIENKIYKDFPEFYNSENYFTVNGMKIHKNKTLKENKISNNDVIILNVLNI